MDKTKKTKKTKTDINVEATTDTGITITVTEEVKKKGRKPKGAKIITIEHDQQPAQQPLTNIILHLKCSTKEYLEYAASNNTLDNTQYNPIAPPLLMTYNADKASNIGSFINEQPLHKDTQAYTEYKTNDICKLCQTKMDEEEKDSIEPNELSDKEINLKLRQLNTTLKNTSEKKSACFWCTHEFDNPTCYIPKQEMENIIYVYGSFCRPECAVAFLMKETMDDSVKFERLHLLNHIYGKIYGYTKSIRPAPDPHYTLEKFYGTLTIQEYRKMLKTNHMLLTIEKPLARLVPEMHEETDEAIINAGKTITYKVRRQSEKVAGPSKSNIVKNVFGIAT